MFSYYITTHFITNNKDYNSVIIFIQYTKHTLSTKIKESRINESLKIKKCFTIIIYKNKNKNKKHKQFTFYT